MSRVLLWVLACGLLWIIPTAFVTAQSVQFDAAQVIADDLHLFRDIGDFNGDGFPDVIDALLRLTPGNANDVHIWLNDGNGNLVQTYTVPFAVPIDDIVALDFDQDGTDDFIVTQNDEVEVYVCHTDSAPEYRRRIALANWADSIRFGDFDANGSEDLFVETMYGYEIYLRNDDQTFTRTYISPSDEVLGPYVISEATGDSTDDLIHFWSGGMVVAEIQMGVVVEQTSYAPGLSSTIGAVGGDIDQDGDDDFVAFNILGQYMIYRRDGPATISVEPALPGGPATHLYDIDNDGDLDGVCCGGGGGPKGRDATPFRISLNVDGTGSFAEAFEIQGVGAHRLAGAVDLNLDGDLDLVAGMAVYDAMGPIAESPHAELESGQQHPRMTVDLDGDGDPDIAPSPEGIYRNLGDGSWTWQEAVVTHAPMGTTFAGPGFPGDFNGDGDEDLIVSHWDDSAGFLGMRFLANDGGGGLVDAGPAADPLVDFHPFDSAGRDRTKRSLAKDLDGDGDVDLALMKVQGATRVWFNNGNAYFAGGVQYPSRIRDVADLDGDGLMELLVLDDEMLAIRWQSPAQVFSIPVALSSLPNTKNLDRVAVADVDRDGDVDLAVLDTATFELWYLENDGFGGFAKTNLGNFGRDTSDLHACCFADVNADQRLDLLAFQGFEDIGGSTYIFLRNELNTGFEYDSTWAMQPSAFADVDGDGDQDLLNEFCIKNLIFDGVEAGNRRQYGNGFGGIAGTAPTLGAVGPFRIGETIQIRVTGLAPQFPFLFVIGVASDSIPNQPTPGNELLTTWDFWVPLVATGDLDRPVSGSAEFHYTLPPALADLSVYHQVLSFRSGVGFVSSNGLELTYR